MSELQYYINLAQEHQKASPLNGCIDEIRSMALKHLSTLVPPHRRLESWKYTSLNQELAKESSLNNYSDSNFQADNLDINFQNIIIVNGIIDTANSNLTDIEIKNISDLSEEEVNKFYNDLDKEFKEDFTTVYNHSFLGKGFYFHIKKNLELPLKITYTGNNENSITGYLNLFEIDKNSEVQLLEEFNHQNPGQITPITLINCGENTNFEHIILQNENKESLYLNGVHSKLARNANYNNISIQIGAKKSRSNLCSQLTGENGHTHLHGLYLLGDEQHHDSLSKIHHQAPHSYSDQLYKGILADKSKGIFTGKVFVDQDAQLIEAKQLNKNLLLSSKAHGFSRPQLEIYADDVKCAHGSTTGQISEEELFYFEARGIPKERARKLLAGAFANDVILKINNTTIRNTILELIEKRDIFKNAKS